MPLPCGSRGVVQARLIRRRRSFLAKKIDQKARFWARYRVRVPSHALLRSVGKSARGERRRRRRAQRDGWMQGGERMRVGARVTNRRALV
eukprot:scaffold523_cov446-Prasinococcus_capsulatus_cf.AAC.7